MNAFEQKLLSFTDVVAQVVGEAASLNNPAYAGIIALGSALVDHLNTTVNTASNPTATLQAASDIAAAVPAAIQAVQTVRSGGATADTKAAAVGSLIGTVETLAGDIISIFHKPTVASAAPVATAAAEKAVASNPVVIAKPAPSQAEIDAARALLAGLPTTETASVPVNAGSGQG